jgi:superfamily II DNA/RNA helicase
MLLTLIYPTFLKHITSNRTGRAGNGGIAISFCSKDEHGIGDIQKLIKVDVKTVSDHPYPWHSGNPETVQEDQPKKNSNRSGGAHKSRKSDASKAKNKNAGTNLNYTSSYQCKKCLCHYGKGIFF